MEAGFPGLAGFRRRVSWARIVSRISEEGAKRSREESASCFRQTRRISVAFSTGKSWRKAERGVAAGRLREGCFSVRERRFSRDFDVVFLIIPDGTSGRYQKGFWSTIGPETGRRIRFSRNGRWAVIWREGGLGRARFRRISRGGRRGVRVRKETLSGGGCRGGETGLRVGGFRVSRVRGRPP